MPSQFWWTRWQKASWLRVLCGRMCEPSMADASVDAWLASLEASPASPTPRPETNSAPRTSATLDPTSSGSSMSASHGGSSSKTSAGCSPPEAPPTSIESFGAAATRLRSDFSQRQNAARRRSESGYSSSQWPTALAADHRSIYATESTHEKNARPLLEVAGAWVRKLWNAPTVASATGGQANRGGDRQGELLLAGQARHLCGLLGLTNSEPGSNTSPTGLTLNPPFVEALMGWPRGWTRFTCSATELSLWRARMRSAISPLPLPSKAPEQQPDLFS